MSTELLEIYLHEKHALSPEWECYRWQHHGESGKPGVLEVTGAIAPLATRGPRKGKRNWKRKDKSTERSFYVDEREFDAWCEEWSARTDTCLKCEGKGECWVSWHIERGATYKTCKACKGTGKRQEQPA